MSDKFIRINAEQSTRLTEQMARFACAAYYRGIWHGTVTEEELEVIIKGATNRFWQRWTAAAKVQLSMAYVLADKEIKGEQS
jgi:hypothetical protein